MLTTPDNSVYNHNDLITLFNQCFYRDYHTTLSAHAEEPLYTPATPDQPARIHFTRDYFASALHEIAHWCIAGEYRRTLEDYGYWYEPDGRTEEQQALFESVEIEPQALEWIFSLCCNAPFRISADNLNSTIGASESFKRNVYNKAVEYLENGLPERPQHFAKALSRHFREDTSPAASELDPATL
ncbi:elongation factor P hydroxylase [Parendozoicomonas sp. Alg238-R29]|uniref:elongation factor P hydroxylase n=1 Tax=Parendozoicomonas sp. Alg238-R29 TaxID=2993446 RepID=UPI00248EDAEC|nr:elongation factor P hydroxylase [Parendozoicomonas sp. Alg238-R29]